LNRQTSDFSHLKDNDGTFGTNVVEWAGEYKNLYQYNA
jgi:hypothetical protein